jgi:hypothetical protein
VGSKRGLPPSDEDGDERKGASEGSAMEEAPAPCSPQGTVSRKKEKLREKRRRRKERRKATGEERWLEEHCLAHSPYDSDCDRYSSPWGSRYGM